MIRVFWHRSLKVNRVAKVEIHPMAVCYTSWSLLQWHSGNKALNTTSSILFCEVVENIISWCIHTQQAVFGKSLHTSQRSGSKTIRGRMFLLVTVTFSWDILEDKGEAQLQSYTCGSCRYSVWRGDIMICTFNTIGNRENCQHLLFCFWL